MRRSVIAAAAALVPLLAHAEERKPVIITNPDWESKPTIDDFYAVYPAEALKRGLNGRAIIGCAVTVEGVLVDCKVQEETPAGVGFGLAAVLLAKRFKMRPQLRDGHPAAGGTVRIPVNFSGASPPSSGTRLPGGAADPGLMMVSTSAWESAPSQAEVEAAYPQRAGATSPAGRVVLRCKVKPDGTLSSCDTLMESPGHLGLGSAAKALAPKFRFLMSAIEPGAERQLGVDVPIVFSPPTAAPRSLAKPAWVRTLPPDRVQGVFPPKAAEAGLSTGRAVLDCIADARGNMTACQVVSEEPAGMDFGVSALRIAAVMGVNPWTEDGHPADGAHVRFALRLNRAPEAPPVGGAPAVK